MYTNKCKYLILKRLIQEIGILYECLKYILKYLSSSVFAREVCKGEGLRGLARRSATLAKSSPCVCVMVKREEEKRAEFEFRRKGRWKKENLGGKDIKWRSKRLN